MCRFNISFNDAVIDEMRPLFADEKALLMWMQAKMEQLMKKYAAQFKPQLKSSTDGAALLNKLQSLPNTPEGFLQLGGILGKAHKDFSWEDLREEALEEKYGV